MKILFGAETYYPNVNGASYFTQRLADRLKKRGHDILVVAPSRRFVNERFEHDGIGICGVKSIPVVVAKFRIAFPFFAKKFIDRAVADFNPDVIHIQGHFFIQRSVFNLGRSKNIPIVATNHFMPENLIHFLPFPRRIISRMVLYQWQKFKEVFENVDAVTTPTKTAAMMIEKINFSKPIQAISCGVDLEKFNPENDAAGIKEKYEIPAKPVLIYTGRLDKEKNIDFIIKAFKKVLEKIDIHLVLAGTGADESRLKGIARSSGLEKNITFTGFISNDNWPDIYRTADCFIIASTAELQSIVTLEAMASGLPVLAVDSMALPELVRDGYNGFLFKLADSGGLAEKIVKIFSDENLRKTMGANSQEIIKDHDINKTADSYEAIYKSLLKRNG